MLDCGKDIISFHDGEVTLPMTERANMRDRRNSNRDRLNSRLKEINKSLPTYIKQGSYAMHTMVQDSKNDYDIDDGVYFDEEDLKDYTPREVREFICDKLKDDRFKLQPTIKDSCARIWYNEGYHVDMPIYRIKKSNGDYELSNGDNWVISRAADVEAWFNKINQEQSPDELNGRQFRRIVRLLKKFARSRDDWKKPVAAGFTITVLVSENYIPEKDSEDVSLRGTMMGLSERLCLNLEVKHPVTPGAMLTKGAQDPRTSFLKDRLKEAIATLSILDAKDCTRKQALEAWGKVFNTPFFKARYDEENEHSSTPENAQKLAILASSSNPPPVDKQGGGRFA